MAEKTSRLRGLYTALVSSLRKVPNLACEAPGTKLHQGQHCTPRSSAACAGRRIGMQDSNIVTQDQKPAMYTALVSSLRRVPTLGFII